MENMNKKNDPELEVCRYLDGELSQEQEFAFEQRMVEDPAFRELVEKYHRVDLLVDQLGVEGVDVDEQSQRDEILAAVDLLIHRRGRRLQRLILRPIIGVCAAAAVFVIAVCLYLIVASSQQYKKSTVSPLSDTSSQTTGRCVVAYHLPPVQSSNVKVRADMVRPGGFGEGESLVYSRTIKTKTVPKAGSVVWAGFSGGGVIAAFTTTTIIDEQILPGIFGYLTY